VWFAEELASSTFSSEAYSAELVHLQSKIDLYSFQKKDRSIYRKQPTTRWRFALLPPEAAGPVAGSCAIQPRRVTARTHTAGRAATRTDTASTKRPSASPRLFAHTWLALVLRSHPPTLPASNATPGGGGRGDRTQSGALDGALPPPGSRCPLRHMRCALEPRPCPSPSPPIRRK